MNRTLPQFNMIIATIAIMLALAAFTTASSDELPADLKALQGRWSITSHTINGKPHTNPHSFIVFDGSRWLASWRKPDGSDQIEAGTVTVTTQGPKVIDLRHDADRYKGEISRFFFQIDGDVLSCVQVFFPGSSDVKELTTVHTTYRHLSPDTIAIDVHDGSAGPPAWNKNFTYTLKADKRISLNRTAIRFRVNTTTAQNSYGEVMVQDGKGEWIFLNEWTPRKLQAAQKSGDWLTMDLASLPLDLSLDTLRIRFDFKTGTAALECYEVEWKHKKKNDERRE